ncbi:transposase, partial [Actinocrinis puniceicyclus]
MAVGLMVPRARDAVETRGAAGAGHEQLRRLRAGIYGCFTRRADALFELCDALLCAPGPVSSPVELSLEPEFRRGHAMVYDALAQGRVDGARLRRVLVGALPAARAGEPLMFGVDVTPIPRAGARYVDGLSMVVVRGAGGDRLLPGWPLSVLVGLSWGASSWVDALEARRIEPGVDHTGVLIAQAEALLDDLSATGRWRAGDVPPLVIFDSGYPAALVAHALEGRAVQVLGRVRADRVFYHRAPAPVPGAGRPPRHGARFECARPASLPEPEERIEAHAERYGRVRVQAWHGLHQALARTGAWAGYPAGRDLPILEGSVIRITVERLAHQGAPKPLWLWHRAPPG